MELVDILSFVISTLTVLSCFFLKVPQILQIKASRSAQGIYLQALLMEITGFSITILYNYENGYSVLTYLEYPIILVQVYVLMYYVLKFKGLLLNWMVLLAILAYVSAVVGFVSNMLPKEILYYLLPLCTPLGGFAKVSYMYGIIKSGNADQVSLSTWIISVCTNLARIFTIYLDSGDIKLMFNFIISTILSAGVFLTAVYYRYKPSAVRRMRHYEHYREIQRRLHFD